MQRRLLRLARLPRERIQRISQSPPFLRSLSDEVAHQRAVDFALADVLPLGGSEAVLLDGFPDEMPRRSAAWATV
jgi:hypothetical protein